MSVFWENQGSMPVAQAQIGMEIRTRNILPNLKAQRQELQLRIEKIDKLLGLLETNPEFVQIIDLSRELI